MDSNSYETASNGAKIPVGKTLINYHVASVQLDSHHWSFISTFHSTYQLTRTAFRCSFHWSWPISLIFYGIVSADYTASPPPVSLRLGTAIRIDVKLPGWIWPGVRSISRVSDAVQNGQKQICTRVSTHFDHLWSFTERNTQLRQKLHLEILANPNGWVRVGNAFGSSWRDLLSESCGIYEIISYVCFAFSSNFYVIYICNCGNMRHDSWTVRRHRTNIFALVLPGCHSSSISSLSSTHFAPSHFRRCFSLISLFLYFFISFSIFLFFSFCFLSFGTPRSIRFSFTAA